MTWKAKKEVATPHALQLFWEKHGTWITGLVAVVLLAVTAVIFIQRQRESALSRAAAELEAISPEDPTAAMHIERLAHEYGGTRLASRIEIKKAQMLFRSGDPGGAEALLGKLAESKGLLPVDRAQVHLCLAYAAQERGDFAEARRRYRQVEEDKLYAVEARKMLERLDRVERERKPEGEKKEDKG